MQQVERMVSVLHPAEVALLLESLPPPERNIVWGVVSPEDEGEVLVELNDEVRARLIEGMPLDELVIVTEGLELDDLADVIADLPEAITQQIVRSLNQQDRER
ncbi:MAG: magnesium transporter, partial [Gammaproteobacteria bacterium]